MKIPPLKQCPFCGYGPRKTFLSKNGDIVRMIIDCKNPTCRVKMQEDVRLDSYSDENPGMKLFDLEFNLTKNWNSRFENNESNEEEKEQ